LEWDWGKGGTALQSLFGVWGGVSKGQKEERSTTRKKLKKSEKGRVLREKKKTERSVRKKKT